MAKMPEIHQNINTGSSGSQIVFHNPAQQPLATSAGQPVIATTKPAGQANGSAAGQVPNSSVVFRNPA